MSSGKKMCFNGGVKRRETDKFFKYGGFEWVFGGLFLENPCKMIQFDEYCSNGLLQPPTRSRIGWFGILTLPGLLIWRLCYPERVVVNLVKCKTNSACITPELEFLLILPAPSLNSQDQ